MSSSSLPSSLLAELTARRGLHWTFDITLGSQTLRFAYRHSPLLAKGVGAYLPHVETIGDSAVSIGFPSGGIASPRLTVVVQDLTRALQKAHASAPRVKDSAVATTGRSERVSDVYTELSGIVHKWRQPGSYKYEYVIGPNDAPLNRSVNIPRLTDAYWPNIPAANRDLPGQAVFGSWSSIGVLGATGMVPAYLVDEQSGIWYVSHGTCDDIPRIYVDGAIDTDWTVKGTRASSTPYIANGVPFTILQDTASTKRTTANAVTVDVDGPQPAGNGSGGANILRFPAEILRAILCNYVFNEWPLNATSSGLGFTFFLVGGSPGNATPWSSAAEVDVEERLGYYGHRCSVLITSDTTVSELIRGWCESFNCYLSWDSAFNLRPVHFPIHRRNLYPSDVIRKDTQLTDSDDLPGETFGEEVVSEIVINYANNEAAGGLVRKHIARDTLSPEYRNGEIQFLYGPASSLA